jgi:hypothetical protein
VLSVCGGARGAGARAVSQLGLFETQAGPGCVHGTPILRAVREGCPACRADIDALVAQHKEAEREQREGVSKKEAVRR